jgi:hypothetical protein
MAGIGGAFPVDVQPARNAITIRKPRPLDMTSCSGCDFVNGLALYHGWPETTTFVQVMRPMIRTMDVDVFDDDATLWSWKRPVTSRGA